MILTLLLACSGGGPEEAPAPMPVAAERATFATVASLGSYHLQTLVKRTVRAGTAEPQTTTETVDLRWKDADHWSYTLGRDGRVRSEVVVWDGVAWSGDGDAPPVEKPDAEPYRVQVASVWDPWEWGLEGLAATVKLEPDDVEIVEGRRAHRHTLGLAVDPAVPRRGWTPTAVSGTVWIDEATAVRLKGQVLLDAVSGDRSQRLELLFSVASIGLDPGVSPPRRDKP